MASDAACAGVACRLGLERQVVAVRGTRGLTKGNMILNGATPNIEVNPETFEVVVDGKRVNLTPAKTISLAQLYWFS